MGFLYGFDIMIFVFAMNDTLRTNTFTLAGKAEI